ncbi:hypothetical protein [Puniceicoccus vermicola]|uniref:Uncharacterized protein n=1 Tax=Puniceicoccus vermicola TaxID=388746 RepID=A0A7X1B252_9BACT|nr:hypothetical protein [Puniceicoccus vermicola]MBC2604231.1 hypothetical protein [Puniceicoccus vermicola]
MAWRIREHVLSGEIDNRVKGRIRGVLHLAGSPNPITLDLEGNAHPDLAGSSIRFRNPRATEASLEGFPREQTGRAGDITASHRVKDLLVSTEEFLAMSEEERSTAYRWANCLYLEWYSPQSCRVVMEGIGYEIEWVEGPLWQISEDDLREQAGRTDDAMEEFLENVAGALADSESSGPSETDEVIPPEEAAADAEADRMDLLNDRILRRVEKEGPSEWDRIHEEEAARLRKERGEPDPTPLTPEEEAVRAEWIEETNAAAREAAEEVQADSWKDEEPPEHPLALECKEFALALRKQDILPKNASDEHPLWEIANGALFASGKLAGALNGCLDGEEWPPDPLTAPSVLVFLKKARHFLQDALRGLDSADEENLLSLQWRTDTRTRLTAILDGTEQLIQEARRSLTNPED